MSGKWQKPAKKIEVIFALVLALGLSLLIYTRFYGPKKTELANLQKDTNAAKSEVETLERFNKIVRDAREKQIQEMSSQVKVETNEDPRLQLIKKSRSPEFRLFEDFMRWITSSGFRGSVEIQTLTYSNRIEYGGFSETQFSLAAAGPYANVMAFMERLEKIPALLTIQDFDLGVDKNDNSYVTVTIKASFYQLEDDNV